VEYTINTTSDEKILTLCAAIMSASEPWITLKRDFHACLRAMHGNFKEVYIATNEHTPVLGCIVLQMAGTFKGYIQSICVAPQARKRGVGRALIQFCEERIFRETPNVFICVSSFNTEAARLYYTLGYEKIGELKDFIIRGYSEIVMRKTIGPISNA
jgi:[ribosomal protein S18]-alanine N-acetyltransferase